MSHFNLEYHQSRSRELLAEAAHERLAREVRKARAPRRFGASLAAFFRKSTKRANAAPRGAPCGIQPAK